MAKTFIGLLFTAFSATNGWHNSPGDEPTEFAAAALPAIDAAP